MSPVGGHDPGGDGMVTTLTQTVPGVLSAIVVSPDGLPVAASPGLERAGAERVAAVAFGLRGLAHGAAGPLGGGPVRQVIVEMHRVFLFVTVCGDGSSLAVTAASDCDVGLVGYEMARLTEPAGAISAPARRADFQGPRPR